MNHRDATQLAIAGNKKVKRANWINFVEPSIALGMMKPVDVLAEDWLVEDDIISISLSDFKNKIKILKDRDQIAILDALGIKP